MKVSFYIVAIKIKWFFKYFVAKALTAFSTEWISNQNLWTLRIRCHRLRTSFWKFIPHYCENNQKWTHDLGLVVHFDQKLFFIWYKCRLKVFSKPSHTPYGNGKMADRLCLASRSQVIRELIYLEFLDFWVCYRRIVSVGVDGVEIKINNSIILWWARKAALTHSK